MLTPTRNARRPVATPALCALALAFAACGGLDTSDWNLAVNDPDVDAATETYRRMDAGMWDAEPGEADILSGDAASLSDRADNGASAKAPLEESGGTLERD